MTTAEHVHQFKRTGHSRQMIEFGEQTEVALAFHDLDEKS